MTNRPQYNEKQAKKLSSPSKDYSILYLKAGKNAREKSNPFSFDI